ncbi:MAG TPA: hypothetical protein VF779_04840, partial [Pyrinomonadaceae bacterium]
SAVRDEITQSIADEKKAIHSQVEEARVTIEQEARRLAADIGSQILRRPISDAVTKSLGLNA